MKVISYCKSGFVNEEVIDRELDHLGGGSLDLYPFSKIDQQLRASGGAIVYYDNRVVHIHLATGGYRSETGAKPAHLSPFDTPTDHADISAAAIANGKRYSSVWIKLKKMNGWRFEFSGYNRDVCLL